MVVETSLDDLVVVSAGGEGVSEVAVDLTVVTIVVSLYDEGVLWRSARKYHSKLLCRECQVNL